MFLSKTKISKKNAYERKQQVSKKAERLEGKKKQKKNWIDELEAYDAIFDD